MVGPTIPDNMTEKRAQCVGCSCEENPSNRLTWQLVRQEIALASEEDVKDWMEQRQGQPSVLVMPVDGGIVAYSLASYCESCLDSFLREYEERNTTCSEMTRDELLGKITTLGEKKDWRIFVLQSQYLAPRGIPNIVLARDKQLLIRSVRGDVTARLRAPHPPAHSLLISPEVPKEIRETLTRKRSRRGSSDTVAFLYMDEKYIDPKASASNQVTSLTGLLVAADAYPRFRDGILKIVPGFDDGPKNLATDIHASELFPGKCDDVHFDFYRKLVRLINELECGVYRRGFSFIPSDPMLQKNEKRLVGLCFRSILISIEDYEDYAQIWPVMETDRTNEQDENFAGYVRWMDQATAYLNATGDGVENLIDDDYMVDNSRFGDVHYVTKKSIVGNAADCVAYLLHCKWLDEKGFRITDYKARLAAIATDLQPSIVDDYVGSFRLDNA